MPDPLPAMKLSPPRTQPAKPVSRASGWLSRVCCVLILCALGNFPGRVQALPSAQPETASKLVPQLAAQRARDVTLPQVRFEDISVKEPLPEGVITALAQDGKGFLWIGTQNGLWRYDGYHLRSFVHEAGNPNSLPGNYVLSLRAAQDGALWVGTISDGLARFDPNTEQFAVFDHQPDQATSLSGNRIAAIAEDSQGGVWVGTDRGLDYLPKGSRQFIHYRHDPTRPASLASNFIHSLLLDRHGRLWVGSANGLQQWAENGRDFVRVAGNEWVGKTVQTLLLASDGKLWAGTALHGAGWLLPDRKTAPAKWPVVWLPLAQGQQQGPGLALSHHAIASITQARPEQIWLATYGGGINIASAQSGEVLQHVRHDPQVPGSLPDDVVVPMLQDRSGLLWVGTWGNGVRFHDQRHVPLSLLRHGRKLPTSLSESFVTSVLELDNGQILLGLEKGGIEIIDRQRGSIGSHVPAAANGLPNSAILALAQTADGSLWAGTREAGLLRLPPHAKLWQAASGLPGSTINKLLLGKDGRLWAATERGVAFWRSTPAPGGGAQPIAQSAAQFPAQFAPQFTSVSDARGHAMTYPVQALAEDRAGRIWAGSQNGLWRLDPTQTGWDVILRQASRPDSLSADYIHSLLVDRRGGLWVSTAKGIDRLLPGSEAAPRFESVSGWFAGGVGKPGNHLGHKLMTDQEGRIWTEAVLIDPSKKQHHVLGKAVGMDMGAIWRGAHGQTRDGMMLFGGPFGVTLFDPLRFVPWHYAPPVVVTGYKINGKNPGSGSLISQPERGLTLKAGSSGFSIEFTALDYSDPKKNRYQYLLQGYDNEWINSDSEHRVASYGNLWPGKYHLQVRGSNRLGQWSEHVLHVPVRILPAFWQTGWFLVALLLLTGSIVYFSMRWWVARLRARATQLQGLIDERTADVLRLGDIGRELAATLDMEQALSRVHRHVMARLDADVFLIGIIEQDMLDFVYHIEHQQRQPNTVLALDEPNRPATLCVREQRELVIPNRAKLQELFGEKIEPMQGDPMQTVVYLPLLAEGQVIGCLSLQSPEPNAYDAGQLEFLRILARYTAIALSNSAAHRAISESHHELSAALDYLKEAQAKLIQAERQQISLDLHDNLSQTMTGVLLQLDTAREVLLSGTEPDQPPPSLSYIERATELARDGMTQTRQLLMRLRSAQNKPAQINLVDALKRDLPRLTVGTRIEVEVIQTGQARVLQADLELGLFRIAQEAVTNALRHGAARKVVVTLGFMVDCVSLSVQDDGKGFDPAAPNHVPGLGLLGMQQRASRLGGNLVLESSPGHGSRIYTVLPLRQEANA